MGTVVERLKADVNTTWKEATTNQLSCTVFQDDLRKLLTAFAAVRAAYENVTTDRTGYTSKEHLEAHNDWLRLKQAADEALRQLDIS